jgi:hypothetical protein
MAIERDAAVTPKPAAMLRPADQVADREMELE